MLEYGFPAKLKAFVKSGKPIMGTCAGLILLAASQQGRKQKFLNLIDIDVKRNAYGRQIESREVDIDIPALGPQPFHAVFIRAPQIEGAGPGVQVLATYQDKIVLARQKNILICCFHPELTDDTRIHKLFMGMVSKKKNSKKA
jgi:5'-phosphate synthase pdxT subunit